MLAIKCLKIAQQAQNWFELDIHPIVFGVSFGIIILSVLFTLIFKNHVLDARIVGIIAGRFDPEVILHRQSRSQREETYQTNISYGVSVEYGAQLMQEEGLEIT